MSVRASLHMRREKNQIDATELFISLIICTTCFGHFYAHHQERVITAYGVQCLDCWLSEVRYGAAGYVSGMRDVARLAQPVEQ